MRITVDGQPRDEALLQLTEAEARELRDSLTHLLTDPPGERHEHVASADFQVEVTVWLEPPGGGARPGLFDIRLPGSGHAPRRLIDELLVPGTEGWVSALEVYGIAAGSGVTDPADLRALAVGLIAEVLARGLMVPGDVTAPGFQPWATSTGEAITRIATDWLGRPDPLVGVGEVCWLGTTDAGERLGAELRRRCGGGAGA